LKDVNDAVDLRNHVLNKFELAAQEQDEQKRQGLLTFVAVGGGPTGVESAGALSELTKLILQRDYPGINLGSVRVMLLEASDKILANLPPALQENTIQVLNSKHVEVRLNAKVKDYDGQVITLTDGTQLPCETLLWSAGVKAASLMSKLGLAQVSLGRVKVLPTLQLPEYPDVYIIGDAAYLEENGKPLPMVAPVAMQQGELAATNILAAAAMKPLKTFHYKNLGSMATIGRNAAVADSFGMQFRGSLAWVVWLVVHLIGLIGFRNRLIVLINWAWDYFFYDRAVRLISRE
jgi:NADH dehydrogenase